MNSVSGDHQHLVIVKLRTAVRQYGALVIPNAGELSDYPGNGYPSTVRLRTAAGQWGAFDIPNAGERSVYPGNGYWQVW